MSMDFKYKKSHCNFAPMIQMHDIKKNKKFNNEKLLCVLEDTNVSAFYDRWGPKEVIQVYDPDINMQGILIIDNNALGPTCGGIKISPSCTPRQVFFRCKKDDFILFTYEYKFWRCCRWY